MKYNGLDLGNGITAPLLTQISEWNLLGHLGRIYGFSYEALAMATTDTKYILIQTDGFDLHVSVEFKATGYALVELYEDAVVSAVGTVLPTSGYNRTTPKVVHSGFFKDPTVTSPGNLIGRRRAYGTSNGANKATSSVIPDVEIILKHDTNYLLKITTLSNATDLFLSGVFYEEET